MRNACLLLVLLFSPVVALLAQQDSAVKDTAAAYRKIAAIAMRAKDIETDRMGNVFIVNNTNQLYKYSKNGKLLSTLNYNFQGNITYVDPSNPMEIYLFYKELNKAVFLDNNLAYRGEADLTALSIGMASAISRSFDNGLWVFDLSDLQLKKMTKEGQNLQLSGNIRQYVAGEKVNPTEICDNGNFVFVNDSVNGILVFDIFCNYKRTIPVYGCQHIKVIEDNLYYYRDNAISRYNLKTFRTATFPLTGQGAIRDISIEKELLYLLGEEEVVILSY